jgi:hypothetical protein
MNAIPKSLWRGLGIVSSPIKNLLFQAGIGWKTQAEIVSLALNT